MRSDSSRRLMNSELESARIDDEEGVRINDHDKKLFPWMKVVTSVVPIIFACGAFYKSIDNIDRRVEENRKSMVGIGEKQNKIYSEQKVMKSKVDRIDRKFDEESKWQRDSHASIDGKLFEQSKDLAVIKVRLGVRERRSSSE